MSLDPKKCPMRRVNNRNRKFCLHRVPRLYCSGRCASYILPQQAKLNEYEFPVKKVANVQAQLARLIEKNYYLNKSAREVSTIDHTTLSLRRAREHASSIAISPAVWG